MPTFPLAGRRLVAALIVLAPAVARAQPALVDSVVAALRVGEQAETALASMQTRLGTGAPLFSPDAVADSVRARLIADARPDPLADALLFLRGPVFSRLLERARANAQDPMALARLTLGLDTPKKGALADSLLAARYVDAAGTTRQMTTILERSMRAVVETVPAARADLERRGQTAEEAIAETVATLDAQIAPLYVASARVVLAGVPPGEVEAAIAYYTSPAGQYVTRALTDGTLAAVLPGIVEWATTMATAPPPTAAEVPARSAKP